MRFMPSLCEHQYQQVHVEYRGLRSNVHLFHCSSLSQPGIYWSVEVQLSRKFNLVQNLSPQRLIYEGFVKIHSNSPGFLYQGCRYNLTTLGAEIYPFFQKPLRPDHDYLVLHTEFAVLSILSSIGPGILRENFSKTLHWSDSYHCYI